VTKSVAVFQTNVRDTTRAKQPE